MDDKNRLPEAKREAYMNWLIVLSLIMFITAAIKTGYGAFLTLLIIVWMYTRKGEKFSISRIKNYKKYKYRTAISILLITIAVVGISKQSWDQKMIRIEREKAAEEQRTLDAYPKPEISIEDYEMDQGNATEYTFTAMVSNADKVTVNGKEQAIEDGRVTAIIPLATMYTDIDIIAKNKYHNDESLITIYRNENQTEKNQRLAEEAKRNITASDLLHEMIASTAIAQNFYKEVTVRGYIYDILDNPSYDGVEVAIETDNPYAFVKGKMYSRGNLRPGQFVKLRCLHPEWDFAEVNVVLNSCSVQ